MIGMSFSFRRCAALTTAMLLFLFSAAFSANAIEIKDVVSPKGIHGWLVEDHSVPIVAIQFSFRSGSTQDPKGKEGLSYLMSGLFDEGAGELNSKTFQARLDDLGGEMSFKASRDVMRGSMRVLAENRDQAVGLLAMAVGKPRFDQDAVDRIRTIVETDIRSSERDPNTIGQKKFSAMIYGKHPYGRREEGTPETLSKITRDDLVALHKQTFARDNLKIGIVGPVTPEEAGKIIDRIFGNLPEKAELTKVDEAKLNLGGLTSVNYNMPQTTMVLVYPGVKRNDPEFFAAYLMNDILGGPGLTSRLFSEVREKRGLAYSVSSMLASFDYSASLIISTGTRADQAQVSLKTIRDEVKRMATNGVTAEELANAKSYVIGSYAVQNMGSSSDIASILVGLQEQNLPIDYMEKRPDLINAVTLEQVNAVAKKMFGREPAILIVGPMKD